MVTKWFNETFSNDVKINEDYYFDVMKTPRSNSLNVLCAKNPMVPIFIRLLIICTHKTKCMEHLESIQFINLCQI